MPRGKAEFDTMDTFRSEPSISVSSVTANKPDIPQLDEMNPAGSKDIQMVDLGDDVEIRGVDPLANALESVLLKESGSELNPSSDGLSHIEEKSVLERVGSSVGMAVNIPVFNDDTGALVSRRAALNAVGRRVATDSGIDIDEESMRDPFEPPSWARVGKARTRGEYIDPMPGNLYPDGPKKKGFEDYNEGVATKGFSVEEKGQLTGGFKKVMQTGRGLVGDLFADPRKAKKVARQASKKLPLAEGSKKISEQQAFDPRRRALSGLRHGVFRGLNKDVVVKELSDDMIVDKGIRSAARRFVSDGRQIARSRETEIAKLVKDTQKQEGAERRVRALIGKVPGFKLKELDDSLTVDKGWKRDLLIASGVGTLTGALGGDIANRIQDERTKAREVGRRFRKARAHSYRKETDEEIIEKGRCFKEVAEDVAARQGVSKQRASAMIAGTWRKSDKPSVQAKLAKAHKKKELNEAIVVKELDDSMIVEKAMSSGSDRNGGLFVPEQFGAVTKNVVELVEEAPMLRRVATWIRRGKKIEGVRHDDTEVKELGASIEIKGMNLGQKVKQVKAQMQSKANTIAKPTSPKMGVTMPKRPQVPTPTIKPKLQTPKRPTGMAPKPMNAKGLEDDIVVKRVATLRKVGGAVKNVLTRPKSAQIAPVVNKPKVAGFERWSAQQAKAQAETVAAAQAKAAAKAQQAPAQAANRKEIRAQQRKNKQMLNQQARNTGKQIPYPEEAKWADLSTGTKVGLGVGAGTVGGIGGGAYLMSGGQNPQYKKMMTRVITKEKANG